MKRLVLYVIFSCIMRWFVKIIVGVKLIDKQNLKQDGPVIYVANHNSHLDAVVILASIPGKQLIHTHPIAAGDYFGKSPFKAALTRFFVNAILIPRNRPKEGETGIDPIQLMIDTLDKGESLIVFPEGSRGEPEIFQKFKRGIGLVLEQRPHIPVIPIHFKGLGKVLPKGDPVPVPFDCYARVGEKIIVSGKTVEEIVTEVEESIHNLGV